MQIPNLEYLKSFYVVCTFGSISNAEAKTGISRATLSRHITILEKDLASILFQRKAGSLQITDVGTTVFKYAQEIIQSSEDLSEAISLKNSDLSGPIRIHASSGLASIHMPRMILGLNVAFENLKLEIKPMASVSMDADEDADIAIQTFMPTRKDLIASKIGEIQCGVYASKTYLEKRGEPKSLSDLEDHCLIGTVPQSLKKVVQETFDIDLSKHEDLIKCEDYPLIWQMVVAGCGIGMTHLFQGDNEPAVKRILTEMDTLTFPVWLVAQPDFKTRARVQLVYRYLADELRLVLNNEHV